MLGKLFNLSGGAGNQAQAQSSSSKQVSSLDSVQEDMHTRCLLFPDPQALHPQHYNDQVFSMSSASALPTSATNPFDLDGDIELESRDVRVIIMQDTSSSSPASLLYDSQPPQVSSPIDRSPTDRSPTGAGLSQVGMQDARRLPPAQRKASTGQSSRPLVIQSGSPQQRQSVFDRRSSVHARTHSKAETEAQRAMREYKQEIDTFASCIFGNNEFLAYKGTSTKVHVVPSDLRNDGPGFGDGRGSIGRSTMRSSKLSQSFSSEAMPSFGQPVSSSRPSDRKRVLITRLFPVNLPADEALSSPRQGHFTDDISEFPFPPANGDAKPKAKKAQLKQKRTPMYAVALIISLPQGPPQTAPASASRSVFRGPSSYNEQQDTFSSSYNSTRRSGWAASGTGFGAFDTFDSGYNIDCEERIDAITRHWDVIMRTLTLMQSVVANQLFTLLKQADISSPDPLPSHANTRVARASSSASQKPLKTNMKFVSLLPNCLVDDNRIKLEVENARTRIVSGLRATRVVTGQNRWPVWRDEARWVEKWAGGRDQGFFFFNLLTGFLSVHTDWLQALSPPKYRRQFLMLQKMKGEDDLSLPARTIIVSQDRVSARRLIFLLAAFLPANQHSPAVRTQRPATSASLGTSAQSPPSFIVPLTKEESLRRKINRRGASRQNSHSRNVSMYTTTSKSSVPSQLAHLSMEGQAARRASDAASIKATTLPLLANDLENRKVSTATLVAETSVPHFTVQKTESQMYGRPGSGNSAATDDLKRSLQRGDSIGSSDTQGSSRWGSVISGLWNGRRRDSEITTSPSRDSLVGRDSSGPISPRKSTSNRRDSLARMVEEVQSPGVKPRSRKENALKKGGDSPVGPRSSQDGLLDSAEPSRAPIPVERKPDPNSAFESPVKTTINEDGVIDVDVPFPDFIASFETAVSSPSSSGYLSAPGLSGLELFEQACRVAIDGDVPMNVAGWLRRFHPDFILQAIPPQDDLIEQVKASLRAEPTPLMALTPDPREERWIDVSSALIADSTDFSIRRIRYRRLVKFQSVASGERTTTTPLLSSSLNTTSSALMTPVMSPYEHQVRDEFIEDAIVTLDDTLIDAVERVLAHSGVSSGSGGEISKESSQASSRSPSKRRDSTAVLDATLSGGAHATETDDSRSAETQTLQSMASQGVPREECKTVVLSALEHLARDVVQARDEASRQGDQAGDRHAGSTRVVGPRHRGRDKESVLREAVRAWVEGVEAGIEAVQ